MKMPFAAVVSDEYLLQGASAPDRKRKTTVDMPASPSPVSKRARIVEHSDDDEEQQQQQIAAAQHIASKAPLAQWTVLFDSDTSSGCSDSEEEEEEDLVVQALVHAAFSSNNHITGTHHQASNSSPVAKLVAGSTPPPPSMKKPDDHVRDMLKAVGKQAKYVAASSLKNFFYQPDEESFVKSYTKKVVQAVRADDVDTLRDLHYNHGHSMMAGSKFGDSLIHLACRRNYVQVLQFLLQELKLPSNLVCDYGRSPLHDACWTSAPNWEIIGLLLDNCPGLLYVTDMRGSTPLEYLPKRHWKDAIAFLERRGVDSLIVDDLS